MALTRPISQDIRDQFDALPTYHHCNVPDKNCSGYIEWHHYFVYAGKRTDDPFGIIAICDYHHDHMTARTRRKLDAIMIGRVTEEIRVKYPRAVWPRV